ncbi:hypothetical protein [Halochromatium roseum]|uniref:hypothetical protein n=1 Tax=Halochromatium roseum TaxID=391920 RepID=UPI001913D08C|nr:hypothetical protein [Halochromatium roseum]MBK5938827.1 hypothetical protein [Halochromatium roseum]
MEAIRTIERVTHGELHLQLPEAFWGKEVEVIILATANEPAPVTKPRKSLRGSLKEYAHPERMAREQTAWSDAVSDAP